MHFTRSALTQKRSIAWPILEVLEDYIQKKLKSQNLFELKNIKNNIINKTNVLKTWCRNFGWPAGMRYNQCVSPAVRPICFLNIPPDTRY